MVYTAVHIFNKNNITIFRLKCERIVRITQVYYPVTLGESLLQVFELCFIFLYRLLTLMQITALLGC